MKPDCLPAAQAARLYRSFRLNPLPSRPDIKGPACRDYARYRDAEPIPDEWLDRWWAPNVQVACGSRWGLGVIDVDGHDACMAWRSLTQGRHTPRTWTAVSGGGGYHLWYRLPAGLEACPSKKLWGVWNPKARGGKGNWVKHKFVELLADKSLIIAPPSRHVDTGQHYRWLPDLGPADLEMATIPDWLLALPEIKPPRAPAMPMRPRVKKGAKGEPEGRYGRKAVLDAIQDKLGLARSWGLRVIDGLPSGGWLNCRAIDREDDHPSARFNVETGYYCEPGARVRLSLFDIAVAYNEYRTWTEARDSLGDAYLRRQA